jgi:hypothetical protein
MTATTKSEIRRNLLEATDTEDTQALKVWAEMHGIQVGDLRLLHEWELLARNVCRILTTPQPVEEEKPEKVEALAEMIEQNPKFKDAKDAQELAGYIYERSHEIEFSLKCKGLFMRFGEMAVPTMLPLRVLAEDALLAIYGWRQPRYWATAIINGCTRDRGWDIRSVYRAIRTGHHRLIQDVATPPSAFEQPGAIPTAQSAPNDALLTIYCNAATLTWVGNSLTVRTIFQARCEAFVRGLRIVEEQNAADRKLDESEITYSPYSHYRNSDLESKPITDWTTEELKSLWIKMSYVQQNALREAGKFDCSISSHSKKTWNNLAKAGMIEKVNWDAIAKRCCEAQIAIKLTERGKLVLGAVQRPLRTR